MGKMKLKKILVSIRPSTGSGLVLWLGWVSLCLILCGFSRDLLPDRFFFDEATIVDLMKDAEDWSQADSYSNTAYFYKIIGITGEGVPLSILSFTVAMGVIYFLWLVLKSAGTRTITTTQIFVITYFLFVQSVFLGIIGKDFIVFLLVAAFWALSKRGLMAFCSWLILASIYAAFFRTQWFIVIVLLLTFLFFIRRGAGIKKVIFIALLFIIALGVVFQSALGVDLDHFRVIVNSERVEGGAEDIRTIINPIFSSGGLLSIANVIITLGMLLVPIPLLAFGELYYLASFLAIALIHFGIGRSYVLTRSENRTFRDDAIFALVFAFLVSQSLYEPDYGSYVRHLAPLAPLMIYLSVIGIKFLSAQRKRKIQ